MNRNHPSILWRIAILLSVASATPIRGHDAAATTFEIDSTEPVRRLAMDTRDSPVPWSHLRFNNGEDTFQFAIVTDRTGSARWGIFQDAIAKLNLLQPEFVMSVGDLIQGYTDDLGQLNLEWDEFTGFIDRLEVPFFFLPGNHDMTNPIMAELWKERFGAAYYSFVYQDVLFLCLNSNDGTIHQILEPQISWVREVLNRHEDVRWTLVFVHMPFWDQEEPDLTSNWEPIEEALGDRKYTVFAGHTHSYTKNVRNDHRYITLATTGGGSGLRGPMFGEFDQVAWVTMTHEGPIIANLMLDGIWDENVRTAGLRSFVEALDQNLEDQLHSEFVDSGTIGRIERQIKVTNNLDIPMHYEATIRAAKGVDLLSEVEIDLLVDPNSVATYPIVAVSGNEISSESMLIAVVDWSASARYESQDYKYEGRSRLHAVRSYTILAIGKRLSPAAVDGRLNDWSDLPIVVEEPVQIQIQPGTWHGPDDGHFRFGVTRDEDYLHIAIDVIDDQIVAIPGKRPWTQDGVEIRIDAHQPPANRTRERDLIFVALGPGDRSDNDVPIYREDALPAGTQYACLVTDTGFAVEIAIPLVALEEQANGQWPSLRINIQVDDTDGDEKGTAQLNWKPAH